MSLHRNTQWIESCLENFDEYVALGNYVLAKAAIVDMFDVAPDTARAMNIVLRNAPLVPFITKSPYQGH